MLSTVNDAQRRLPNGIVGVSHSSAALPGRTQEKVRYGELRQAAFWVMNDVLHLLRTQRWKVDYAATAQFRREQELPYLESASAEEVATAVEDTLKEILPSVDDAELVFNGVTIVRALNEAASAYAVVEALKDIFALYDDIHVRLSLDPLTRFFAPPDAAQQMTVSVPAPFVDGQQGCMTVAWPSHFGASLVEAVQSHAAWLRDQRRGPTVSEFVTEHVAYVFLANGKQLDALAFRRDAKWLGTVGFREVAQTYPSLTDPGDGHIFGTTRRASWMNGAIVHVEHLERPGGVARTLIESYRIPAILDFARVRLHTAGAMPNTYFTGRALRDAAGTFQQSFIKVVNTTSAACSQAFSLGAAECKIAMDDLSTGQMLAYLKALAGHTLRCPHQFLSCAFNLNWPIVHDTRTDERTGALLPPRLVTDPYEIALLAIDIAVQGGFDKVTWDGASDTYPSTCIIHQLPFEQWLELAHRAHEAGLTTYASAGFKFPQIRFGVWAGIDGLGIGGAQILRHMDHDSGMHGPYTEENLDRILDARDQAAAHVRGRGVALLARLDRMFFEGTLTTHEDTLRRNLFAVLQRSDEPCIEAMLKHPALAHVRAMQHDGQRPFTAWAQRVLRHAAPDELLLQRIATPEEWNQLVTQLTLTLGPFAPTSQSLIPSPANTASAEVEEDVFDVHVGRAWTNLRIRKAQQSPHGRAVSRHDDMVKLKTTPFSSNAHSRRSSRRSSAAPSPMISRRTTSSSLHHSPSP